MNLIQISLTIQNVFFPSFSGFNPHNLIAFTCHVAFISFNLDEFLSFSLSVMTMPGLKVLFML